MTLSPIYQIRIAGLLDLSWSDWFDGLAITYSADDPPHVICLYPQRVWASRPFSHNASGSGEREMIGFTGRKITDQKLSSATWPLFLGITFTFTWLVWPLLIVLVVLAFVLVLLHKGRTHIAINKESL